MTESELEVCWQLKKSIRDKNDEMQRLREVLTHLTHELSDMPRAQILESRIAAITSRVLTLEEEIGELRKKLREAQIELTTQLCTTAISTPEFSVIHRRYVKCMRFRDIGFELNYSDATVFRLHKTGLRKLLKS